MWSFRKAAALKSETTWAVWDVENDGSWRRIWTDAGLLLLYVECLDYI